MEKPIFAQIVDMLETDILAGTYQADELVISTPQIAKLLSVNPATAQKAVALLTDRGILYKRRGVGMAVSPNAVNVILEDRRKIFFEKTLPDFLSESEKLGIAKEELTKLILK